MCIVHGIIVYSIPAIERYKAHHLPLRNTQITQNSCVNITHYNMSAVQIHINYSARYLGSLSSPKTVVATTIPRAIRHDNGLPAQSRIRNRTPRTTSGVSRGVLRVLEHPPGFARTRLTHPTPKSIHYFSGHYSDERRQ